VFHFHWLAEAQVHTERQRRDKIGQPGPRMAATRSDQAI